MAIFRNIKNSLLGGQMSPTAMARTDLPQFHVGCELLQNMIPMLSGGAYRRPGTMNVDSLPIDTYLAPRLIPFVVSRNEAYAICLQPLVSGGFNLVIYRAASNQSTGVVKSAGTGTPPYFTATLTTWNVNGIPDDEIHLIQFTQIADTMWLVHPNHIPQVITRTAIDTFAIQNFDDAAVAKGIQKFQAYPFLNQNITSTTLKPSATGAGPANLVASASLFTGNSIGTIYKINQAGLIGNFLVTGYTSATQVSGTILDGFSTAGTAYAEWWESAWSPTRGWPRTVCVFQQRLCMGGTVGNLGVKGSPDSVFFSETDNYFKFNLIGDSAPAAAVVVNGVVTTPTTGLIHYPVFDSQGDGASTGPTGAQPFTITLSQNTLDTIQWLSPEKELLVGTLSQEWIISPLNGSFDIANSPTLIQSHYGSDYQPAVRIGYELIFPLNTQDEVRAYQYNYIDASFFAEPIQLLFDQYPQRELGAPTSSGRRKFRNMEWDTTRQTLWCLDTWGNFFGMTRDRKLSSTMWHTHRFGGYNPDQGESTVGSGSDKTIDPAYYQCDGSVTSFCVVPNPISGVNDVWLVVKRTLPGTNVLNWQIERMMGKNITRNSSYEALFPGLSAQEPLLVDSAVAQSDTSDGSVSYGGLQCLYGYTPSGNYYSGETGIFVAAGTAVTIGGGSNLTSNLPPDYGQDGSGWVVFGLDFTSIIWPNRLDAGSVIGSAQAALKRINRVFIRFYKTLSCLVGSPPTGNNLQPDGTWRGEDLQGLQNIVFTNANQGSGQSPELFTGDKKANTATTYTREGYIYLAQSDPLPFTVLGIVYEGVEFDG